MAVSPDGTIAVVTNRPLVARIDSRTRRPIDARPVTQARSPLDQLLPPVAAAKGPGGSSVVFSPDGGFAYVIASPDQWWGPLAKIDLATAKVVARGSALKFVAGIGLSEDGQRLYALEIDEIDARRVALLDPGTLRVASRSATLDLDLFAIVAVRTPLAATGASPTPAPTPASVSNSIRTAELVPGCATDQLPTLDIAFPPPPGDAPGTGSTSAEAAFRRAFPSLTDFVLSRPFGGSSSAPVWIVAGGRTFIAELHGTPAGSNWFAYAATFVGCRNVTAPGTVIRTCGQLTDYARYDARLRLAVQSGVTVNFDLQNKDAKDPPPSDIGQRFAAGLPEVVVVTGRILGPEEATSAIAFSLADFTVSRVEACA